MTTFIGFPVCKKQNALSSVTKNNAAALEIQYARKKCGIQKMRKVSISHSLSHIISRFFNPFN